MITKMEQRLLSLMGDRAVVGDKVEELGIKRKLLPSLHSDGLTNKKSKGRYNDRYHNYTDGQTVFFFFFNVC